MNYGKCLVGYFLLVLQRVLGRCFSWVGTISESALRSKQLNISMHKPSHNRNQTRHIHLIKKKRKQKPSAIFH